MQGAASTANIAQDSLRRCVLPSGFPLHVLIRPRAGDFLYDAQELAGELRHPACTVKCIYVSYSSPAYIPLDHAWSISHS